jgi:hypothetical protein
MIVAGLRPWVWVASMLSLQPCVQTKKHAEGDIGYRFVQFTDIHMEPFYNPENGHAKGDVCRVSEAFNKSQCIPFRIEPEASIYPFGRLNCDLVSLKIMFYLLLLVLLLIVVCLFIYFLLTP